MTIQDSEKAMALIDNSLFQGRIMYCIWRKALIAWEDDVADKESQMNAAKAIQADPAKLRLSTQFFLTNPEIIGVVDPANGGGDVIDTLLMDQSASYLTDWANIVLGLVAP